MVGCVMQSAGSRGSVQMVSCSACSSRTLVPSVLRQGQIRALVPRALPGSSLLPVQQQRSRKEEGLQICKGAADYDAPSAPELPVDRLGEAARKALTRATAAVRRYGWLSFWAQLSLSVVSGVILLFSVAFTSQSGPKAALYLTLFGILAGFLSTFWNFGYTRTAMKMQNYLDSPPGADVPKVKKQQVMDMVTRGAFINMLGLGSTLAGVQALVGTLVAKTLSNASANPFISSSTYNPVLALDVFLVQAATNTLMGHFFSLCCSLWLLQVVGEGQGPRFQRFVSILRLEQRVEESELPRAERLSKATARSSSVQGIRSFGGGVLPAVPAASAMSPASLTSALAATSDGLEGWDAGSSSSSSSGPRGLSTVPGRTAAPSRSGTPPRPGGRSRSSSPDAGASRGGAAGSPYLVQTATSTSAAAAPVAAVSAMAVPAVQQEPEILSPGMRSGGIASTSGRSSASRDRSGSSSRSNGMSLRSRQQRPLFFPTAQSLTYLDGTLPGDYGFDPLGLFSPEVNAGALSQRWLHTSEVVHGRWAMLGAAGCLAPEYLAEQGALPKEFGEALWFSSGFLPPAGSFGAYWTSPDKLFAIQMTLMGIVELARLKEYRSPGSFKSGLVFDSPSVFANCSDSTTYPGGTAFNPLNLGDTTGAMNELKLAEIKHGRLAMLAMLGFFAQAAVTGQGPYLNFVLHVEDPLQHNLLANLSSVFNGEGQEEGVREAYQALHGSSGHGGEGAGHGAGGGHGGGHGDGEGGGHGGHGASKKEELERASALMNVAPPGSNAAFMQRLIDIGNRA